MEEERVDTTKEIKPGTTSESGNINEILEWQPFFKQLL